MKRVSGFFRRMFGILMMLLLLFQTAVPSFASENRQTIKVGFFAFDGYHMIDSNGVKSGYGYEFLRLAARYIDVDYQYVGYNCGWDDMLDMLESGEIDLVTSAQITKERLTDFAFSEAIGESSAMLTARSQDHSVIAGNYRTYDGMKIGLLEENSRNNDLADFAKDKGFTYTPVYFTLAEDLERALASGRVDAACTSSLRKTETEKVLDTFRAHEFYAVVRKDDTELLNKINYAIEQMNAVEGDWKNDLANKYYEHNEIRDLSLTHAEMELINKYKTGDTPLKMSVCTDKEPYAYTENGKAKGILVDYFDRLADYLGIPYEVVVTSDRAEYVDIIEEEQADVFLDGRFSSLYQAESMGKSLSTPYTTMRLAKVVRRDFDGDVKTLAVSSDQGQFGIDDGLLTTAKRIKVKSREEAMQAVLDGEADATFVYLYTAQQFINQDERGLLTYTLLGEPTFDYHLAFSDSVDRTLAGIFTKAIYAMPEGTFENIASEYTNYKSEDVSLLTWIKIYPLPSIMVCAAAFIICIFIVFFIERQKVYTLEKKRFEELKELALEAERANMAKSDFLANVSHDIRTPMNAIVGFANLLENDSSDPEKLHEYIQKIKHSSQHLQSLIDDVLDMSKIEANKLTFSPENISLTGQVKQVESIIKVMSDKREQSFNVNITNLVHDYIVADGARLRQILINLLSNAVKYTPIGGKIELSLEELECDKPNFANIRFVVADNGCGMTEDFIEHIFEPFVRNEASVTNKIQGTGLGMPITKSIVTQMKGTIDVKSKPNEGSTFEVVLTLPIAKTTEENKTKKDGNMLKGRNFLCAEDNELNAEILKATLEMYEASCTVYPDGAELVKAFENVKEGEYDAILMDVQMPNMNGLEAARAIRESKNPVGKTIPIIAMTANAFEDDVQRSFDAGMNAHISKPINVGVLGKTVEELCHFEK